MGFQTGLLIGLVLPAVLGINGVALPAINAKRRASRASSVVMNHDGSLTPMSQNLAGAGEDENEVVKMPSFQQVAGAGEDEDKGAIKPSLQQLVGAGGVETDVVNAASLQQLAGAGEDENENVEKTSFEQLGVVGEEEKEVVKTALLQHFAEVGDDEDAVAKTVFLLQFEGAGEENDEVVKTVSLQQVEDMGKGRDEDEVGKKVSLEELAEAGEDDDHVQKPALQLLEGAGEDEDEDLVNVNQQTVGTGEDEAEGAGALLKPTIAYTCDSARFMCESGLCRNMKNGADWDSGVHGAYCTKTKLNGADAKASWCENQCWRTGSCKAAGHYPGGCDLFTSMKSGKPTDCPAGFTATVASNPGSNPEPDKYFGQKTSSYPTGVCFVRKNPVK